MQIKDSSALYIVDDVIKFGGDVLFVYAYKPVHVGLDVLFMHDLQSVGRFWFINLSVS